MPYFVAPTDPQQPKGRIKFTDTLHGGTTRRDSPWCGVNWISFIHTQSKAHSLCQSPTHPISWRGGRKAERPPVNDSYGFCFTVPPSTTRQTINYYFLYLCCCCCCSVTLLGGGCENISFLLCVAWPPLPLLLLVPFNSYSPWQPPRHFVLEVSGQCLLRLISQSDRHRDSP